MGRAQVPLYGSDFEREGAVLNVRLVVSRLVITNGSCLIGAQQAISGQTHN